MKNNGSVRSFRNSWWKLFTIVTSVRMFVRRLIEEFLPDLFNEMFFFFEFLILLNKKAIRVVFLCEFLHWVAFFPEQAKFELRITICWITLEKIVNSTKIVLDTSLPRVVGKEMFFLCFSFAVSNTTMSSHFDDVLRNWESIESPLVKSWPTKALNQT